MDDGREPDPLTPELLADLQAGLLDDEAAAALRQRIRSDPDAADTLAALDQIRRDLAALGTDKASAADVPAAVTARIGAALRAAHAPAHSVRHTSRRQPIALLAGAGAALIGAVGGALMLLWPPDQGLSAGPTAHRITVSRPAMKLPMPTPQIVGLLSQSPDYGPLADPARRVSCLSALGYSATTAVLGAAPVDIDGRSAVLILLPTDSPEKVLALAVAPDCSAANTRLLADAVVARP